jgi:hypothetical protein
MTKRWRPIVRFAVHAIKLSCEAIAADMGIV